MDRRRILGVDDDPVNNEIVQDILGEEFEVTTVGTGEQCLDVVRSFRPDLILLDVMMPGLDGYEVCRVLKGRSETRVIPVILVSARAGLEDRLRGYRSGANDYVTKPFHPLELLERVRAHIRSKTETEASRTQSQLLDLLCQATRAPINSIIGLAGGLLEERSSWSGNDREYIAEIQRCGDYLLSLIEKTFLILDLEHDAEPRREEVDIERLLASVIREVEQLEENRAVEIHVDSDVQGLTVNVERESVARALGAVLDNAVKFSPEGGTVGVDLRVENAELIIAVRDRGPGVPPEEAESIFQVGVVRQRGYPGFGIGLGLPIAKRVVERHGGRLFLDGSSGPGATFVLSLPIASPVTA